MVSNKQQATFIAFEGTDGAGKSTVARATFDKLAGDGYNLNFIDKNRPPVQSGYSEYHLARIREILWDYPDDAPLEKLGDKHWLHLIAAWFHAADFAAISPLLEQGQSCLADGWYFKYLARFLLKDNAISQHAAAAFAGVRKPDYVIFLDVDPSVAARRKESFRASESGAYDGASEDRINGFINYQQRVRESYRQCGVENWISIDTTHLTEAAVLNQSIDVVSTILQRNA
ncbi:MAG: thymidylate kinase [Pseudomonas sp.]